MAKNVEGVGPDAPVITLDGGGQRSDTPYAFDQLPPRAMFAIARRFAYGMEKGYKRGNWKKLPVLNFLGHGLQHAFAFLAGDTQEGDPGVHLEAAAWNFVCAVEVYLESGDKIEELPKEQPHMPVQVDWPSDVHNHAMSVLRNTIQRNKVQGHDKENFALGYVLHALREREIEATTKK